LKQTRVSLGRGIHHVDLKSVVELAVLEEVPAPDPGRVPDPGGASRELMETPSSTTAFKST